MKSATQRSHFRKLCPVASSAFSMHLARSLRLGGHILFAADRLWFVWIAVWISNLEHCLNVLPQCPQLTFLRPVSYSKTCFFSSGSFSNVALHTPQLYIFCFVPSDRKFGSGVSSFGRLLTSPSGGKCTGNDSASTSPEVTVAAGNGARSRPVSFSSLLLSMVTSWSETLSLKSPNLLSGANDSQTNRSSSAEPHVPSFSSFGCTSVSIFTMSSGVDRSDTSFLMFRERPSTTGVVTIGFVSVPRALASLRSCTSPSEPCGRKRSGLDGRSCRTSLTSISLGLSVFTK